MYGTFREQVEKFLFWLSGNNPPDKDASKSTSEITAKQNNEMSNVQIIFGVYSPMESFKSRQVFTREGKKKKKEKAFLICAQIHSLIKPPQEVWAL